MSKTFENKFVVSNIIVLTTNKSSTEKIIIRALYLGCLSCFDLKNSATVAAIIDILIRLTPDSNNDIK